MSQLNDLHVMILLGIYQKKSLRTIARENGCSLRWIQLILRDELEPVYVLNPYIKGGPWKWKARSLTPLGTSILEAQGYKEKNER